MIFLLLRVIDAQRVAATEGRSCAYQREKRQSNTSNRGVSLWPRRDSGPAVAMMANATLKRNKTVVMPKTPQDLGMPECMDDFDCTYDSVCVPGYNGYKTCICAGACPPSVPVSCRTEGRYADDYCLSMSDDYREKYAMPKPMCKTGVCVCPPMFESWLGFEGFVSLLPIKCAKRDLRIQGFAYPSDTVYVGGAVRLFCCINIDPRSFVAEDGVRFIHNSSIVRRSSSTPFSKGFMDGVEPSRCWELDIANVQLLDGGFYTCCAQVSPSAAIRAIEANDTFSLRVKARQVGGDVLVHLQQPSLHIPLRPEPLDSDGLVEAHRVLTISRRHTEEVPSLSLPANNTEREYLCGGT